MIKKFARYSLFGFAVLLLTVFCQFVPYAAAQTPAAQPTPVEIKIDPVKFDPYVGQYEDAENMGGQIFSFLREGDKYYLRVTNYNKLEIFPAAENKFFLKLFPAEAEFVRDAGGRVAEMVWRQNGRVSRMKRI